MCLLTRGPGAPCGPGGPGDPFFPRLPRSPWTNDQTSTDAKLNPNCIILEKIELPLCLLSLGPLGAPVDRENLGTLGCHEYLECLEHLEVQTHQVHPEVKKKTLDKRSQFHIQVDFHPLYNCCLF